MQRSTVSIGSRCRSSRTSTHIKLETHLAFGTKDLVNLRHSCTSSDYRLTILIDDIIPVLDFSGWKMFKYGSSWPIPPTIYPSQDGCCTSRARTLHTTFPRRDVRVYPLWQTQLTKPRKRTLVRKPRTRGNLLASSSQSPFSAS
jgi:hypothetical protein